MNLQEFTNVPEEGTKALLGTDETNAVVPEGGELMFYGDGGAGKTTLAIDLAFHMAAGKDWLGIPVPRPVRVLLIENEGPRPLLRKKLKRKGEAWTGGDLADRVRVFDEPWGRFTFAIDLWRTELALEVAGQGIDMVIAGPLTRLGMDQAGTLQEVAAFMELIAEVREICERPLTLGLIHHENKAHAVSGAWEGSGDTLMHVQSGGNGHTIVFFQKARWAPEQHRGTLKLAWAAGESLELEAAERDLLQDVDRLLSDGKWRTAKEIAAPAERGGVGANVDTVKELLAGHPDMFDSVTGEAAKMLGRHPSATVWLKVTQPPESPESGHDLTGGEGAGDSVTPPLRGVTSIESPPLLVQEVTRGPESAQSGLNGDEEEDVPGDELYERVSRYVEDHPDATAAEVGAEIAAIHGVVDPGATAA